MLNLKRRLEAIERSRNSGACSMISAVEVTSIKAALRRKLGLPAETEGITAPLSRKSVERADSSALQKLRTFLERAMLGLMHDTEMI